MCARGSVLQETPAALVTCTPEQPQRDQEGAISVAPGFVGGDVQVCGGCQGSFPCWSCSGYGLLCPSVFPCRCRDLVLSLWGSIPWLICALVGLQSLPSPGSHRPADTLGCPGSSSFLSWRTFCALCHVGQSWVCSSVTCHHLHCHHTTVGLSKSNSWALAATDVGTFPLQNPWSYRPLRWGNSLGLN